MNTSTEPVSSRKLIIATIVALIAALIILITIILPAEFGKDPTGVGSMLGLTKMGESKQTPEVAAVIAAPVVETVVEPAVAESTIQVSELVATSEHKADEFVINIPPGKGLEYKATMKKGQSMDFNWSTDKGDLYFDFHGDPEFAKNGEFTSYKESTASSDKGSFIADFNGVHGWYWKNRSQEIITVRLKTQGNYLSIGPVH